MSTGTHSVPFLISEYGNSLSSLPQPICVYHTQCTVILLFCFKVEAVDLISEDKAPRIVQPEEGATYDKIWKKKDVAKVNI